MLSILFAVQMGNMTGLNSPGHHNFCFPLMKTSECTSVAASGTTSSPRIKDYELGLYPSCSKFFLTQRTHRMLLQLKLLWVTGKTLWM